MSLSGILLGLINVAIVVAILMLIGAVIVWFASWMSIAIPANVQRGFMVVVFLIGLYMLVALLFGIPTIRLISIEWPMNEGDGRRWKFSLQTIIAVVAAIGAVAGVLISWGSTLSGLQRDTDRNTAGVERLTLGLEQNDSKTDQLDTRVVALEKIAADAITLRRELEGTLGEFKADIEVIKSILQRLEQQQQQPPR